MQKEEANIPAVREAEAKDASAVFELVQRTIQASYPEHYDPAVVAGFSSLHGIEEIESAIKSGKVFVLESAGEIEATGTLDGSHITRVFVLPERQGAGCGTRIMDALEQEAARQGNAEAVLDTSIPAKAFYLHRGYSVTGVERWDIAATSSHPATFLMYETMAKPLA